MTKGQWVGILQSPLKALEKHVPLRYRLDRKTKETQESYQPRGQKKEVSTRLELERKTQALLFYLNG
jgi:hypothetical protein